MIRNIAAVIVGMLVGMVLNAGVVGVSSAVLYPMPDGFDYNDATQMAQYVKNLPAGAFVLAIVAHALQAGVGGWLAARLGDSRPLVLSGAIGAITLAGSVYNLSTLPAPSWMWMEVPLLLLVSWRAGLMEQQRRATLPKAPSGAGEA